MGNTFFAVSRIKNKNGKPQPRQGGTDIDSEDAPLLVEPSCYSLLAFLGALGLYPVKDLEYGSNDYLRGKLSATTPFTAEWDPQGRTDFNIDFGANVFIAVYDTVKKFAEYGITFSNANFQSIDELVAVLLSSGFDAKYATLAEVDARLREISDHAIDGVFGGRLGTFSLSKEQLNTAVLRHDRRKNAEKTRKKAKVPGSLALPYC